MEGNVENLVFPMLQMSLSREFDFLAKFWLGFLQFSRAAKLGVYGNELMINNDVNQMGM